MCVRALFGQMLDVLQLAFQSNISVQSTADKSLFHQFIFRFVVIAIEWAQMIEPNSHGNTEKKIEIDCVGV